MQTRSKSKMEARKRRTRSSGSSTASTSAKSKSRGVSVDSSSSKSKTTGAKHPLKGCKVQCGNILKTLQKDCVEMRDSTALYRSGEFEALRLRLEEDGFIFVRGVVPRELAIGARKTMLKQACIDGSAIRDEEDSAEDAHETDADEGVEYMRGRMARVALAGGRSKKKEWAAGYCVDAMSGSETNEREGIDADAWREIGESKQTVAVYNGSAVRQFWANVFGAKAVAPLVTQTFLRLMGSSATQEHADYYYFKKDTDVFATKSGMDAIHVATAFAEENPVPVLESVQAMVDASFKMGVPKYALKKAVCPKSRECSVCQRGFEETDVGADVWQRAAVGDFGTEGHWHCPECANSPLAMYTTWISLSKLQMPKDSILCMCPGTHRLQRFDTPVFRKQLPGDFSAKASLWCVPYTVEPGDVVLFHIKTIHASTLNNSKPRCYRASFDTRIQLTAAHPTSASASLKRKRAAASE